MPKKRTETWLLVGVVGFGLLLVAIPGLWVYMSATATPLHPSAQDVPSATQSAPEAEWTSAVERARPMVRAHLAERNLPGLSVAVGAGDGLVWAEGFGWADIDARVPVSPQTLFRIGTASKVLTSAAAGLLIEEGRLALDDEIQQHVPEFPKKEHPLTLRRLMGHTAGLATDGGDEGPLFTRHCEQPSHALPVFADRPLLFEPGTRYRYSSYAWILVSAAIEAAADEPFLMFMQKRVFEPLDMDDTRPDSATEPIPNRSTSYFPRFAADPRYGPDVMRDIDLSCYSGASVFLSTPSDLVRFGMGIDRGQFLQPATVAVLQAPGRLPSGEDTGYGLGWDAETVTLSGEQSRVAGHDGDLLGGMVASLIVVGRQGLVVAVTSNTSYADTRTVASQIAQVFAERR